jgi:hypothetical protein
VYFVTDFFNLDSIALGMNNGLTGMLPTELKELAELQGLHLSGTALTGSLALASCIGNFDITKFDADCAVREEAEVQCSCCTVCCVGIDDEPYTCGRNPFTKALSVLLKEADLLDRRALYSPGTPQFQALTWLVYDDPANLNFQLLPSKEDELLERYVIALLYFSTGGDNWDDSSEFLSAFSVCSWNGVECDPLFDNDVVVEISHNANNLRGQLLTELGLLSKLRYLDLGRNLITGRIPSELGKLTNLQYFKACKSATVSSRSWTQ